MAKYSYDFSVIGGDKRQYYLAKILKKRGYKVGTYLLESFQEKEEIPCMNSFETAIRSAKNILAPTPMGIQKEGKKELFHFENQKILIEKFEEEMQEKQRLFAGCIPEEVKEGLLQKGIVIFDYMTRKEIAIYNSVATAEGVIAEAIIHNPKNIYKSRCVVLGYGICGKTIVQYLKGMGAYVTVCVRREEAKASASLMADEAIFIEDMTASLKKSDFIFNTIPDKILKTSILKQLKNQPMILDIASGSGGVDYEYAKQVGIEAYLCKALPGKYAPESSAAILAKLILENEN